MPSIINATTTAGVSVQGDNSGELALQTNNGTNAITIDTAQNVTLAKSAITLGTTTLGAGNSSAMKNRIINGAMVINQRGGTTTVNSGTVYGIDRWAGGATTSAGVFTFRQTTNAPVGFTQSMFIEVTTADASLAATDNYSIRQTIEGYNVADLGWGTANAKTVTLSFWVRSNLTGTFGGAVKNASTRAYPFSYTISAANTYEYKTITIAGDTTGTWNTDNTAGIFVLFSLGMGSDYVNTAGAWAAGNFLSSTGATNVMASTSNNFYIAGVQLEVGTQATSFDYRQYTTELQLCQRYYYKEENLTNAITLAGFAASTTTASVFNNFPVSMRIAPTALEQTGTAANYRVVGGGASATTCSAVPAFSSATTNLARTTFTVASGLVIYNGCVGSPASGVTAYLAWSAEL
jgi:hypothetical protein